MNVKIMRVPSIENALSNRLFRPTYFSQTSPNFFAIFWWIEIFFIKIRNHYNIIKNAKKPYFWDDIIFENTPSEYIWTFSDIS